MHTVKSNALDKIVFQFLYAWTKVGLFRGGYRGGPGGGGYNSRGGFQPRGGPPRNPAPWQQPNNFGNNFGPRGGYPGFPPPPAVNIPSTKPPPPPEDPPEPAPWEQNAGGAGSWGMMPPVMPPWVRTHSVHNN